MTIPVEQALPIAIAHHQAGRLAEAEAICRQILAQRPDQPVALHLLGVIAVTAERYDDALEFLSKAADQAPTHAPCHSDLGVTYRRLGRLEEAVACLQRAAILQPDLPEVHLNLGDVLHALGRFDEAIECSRRAVALRPDYAEALNNLGTSLTEKGQFDEAIACLQRALALKPDYLDAHLTLGKAFSEKQQWAEGITCFRRALALKPDHPETNLNLSSALAETGQREEATVCLQRFIALQPDYPEAHLNLGTILSEMGRWNEAMACIRQALDLRPDFAAAHWSLAIALLLLGHHEEGWKEHEWRWLSPTLASPRRNFSARQWDGKPAPGETILLHAEQGLGDTIQFLRYVPLVRDRANAARIILEYPPPLSRLLVSSGDWNVELVTRQSWDEAALPPFDQHLPLLSLPLALGLFDPQAMAGPYLRANPESCVAWRTRLGGTSAFRVGLVWAGNPGHKDDRRRSLQPEKYLPILSLPGVSCYSLQIDPCGTKHGVLTDAGLIDLTAHVSDFADTAALMAELDLIISVDTATAHLAGALGRPVWTLLPFVPDWRWGLGREDTPWYPTMRLFRQPAMGDWDSVIQRVAAELKNTVERQGPHQIP